MLLESGMGESGSSWGAVIPLLAEHTTVVAYDRSGLGGSTFDPAPRDLDRLTDDLLELLAQVGGGPFVGVGHSWGGPIVRSAAARGAPVTGLVLVDPTDEGCDLFFGPGSVRQQRIGERLLPALARVGLLRTAARRQAKLLPEPWSTRVRSGHGTVATTRTVLAEMSGWLDDLKVLRDHPLPDPGVPVVVISGSKAGVLERSRREPLMAAHRAHAESMANGRHVLATNSSHQVHLTEPSLVADEVLALVQRARSGPARSTSDQG